MKMSEPDHAHAGLRHEIRNNLTLLSSRLQLLAAKYPFLKEDELYIQLQEDINAIYTVLNYDKNGFRLQLLPCNMKSLLEEVYNACLPLFQSKGLELLPDIPDDLPIIRIDARLIYQALLNLLKNAAEASVSGQQVCLKALADNTCLLITVKDSGIGITAKQQEHIFEPFISYKKGGTGLGLPMVRSTVYAHHGHLDFYSEPGVGTTFQISLPLPSSPV